MVLEYYLIIIKVLTNGIRILSHHNKVLTNGIRILSHHNKGADKGY